MTKIKIEKITHGIGVMSGTSLDGLDIAYCKFSTKNGKIKHEIICAETIKYQKKIEFSLKNANLLIGRDYFELNAMYGAFIADLCNKFIKKHKLTPQFIASHGHTIFHEPKNGFSTQLGCGATIAANTNLTTVCDFRSLDVALNGQGAPLVPIGDELLFKNYDACLNLGGIANISFNQKHKRIAFDICLVNIVLNDLSNKLGLDYDKDGLTARNNALNFELLDKLEQLKFYKIKGAKSLGREFYDNEVKKIFTKYKIEDVITTYTHHAATQIAAILNKNKLSNVLCTGGGTFNKFLIELIQSKTNCKLIIPNNLIINFKEALIFAFLGYLRLNNKDNSLASVTGAIRNSCGGAVYTGKI
ncbi:MAG: anhydro-N-acetylmuramic acid kinase [Bacteroidia bacterium]